MYNNHSIISINYSDAKYEKQRRYNTLTAYSKGKVDKVIEYSLEDIDNDFYKKNKSIFDYKRGAGLWLWKPYIILKTLSKMDEGHYLFYCDSGAYYVNKLSKLIDVMEAEAVSVMCFEIPLLEKQWTKKETFSFIGYSNFDRNQICASYILLKKNPESLKIVEKWLYYAQNERCISYKQFSDEPNFDDFIEHREDQSIFSIICHMNNITPFRDPSQYGDRPWQYAWCKIHKGKWKMWTYNEKKYTNSLYPRIIVSNRGADPIKFKIKEYIRNIVWKLGIYKYYFKYIMGANF